jgi:hypothetical protein
MKLETMLEKRIPANLSHCAYCNAAFYKLTPWQRFCCPSHKNIYHNKSPRNREQHYIHAREMYLSNPDYFREKQKERDARYRESHRDKINAYAKKYYWEIRPRYMRNGKLIYLPKDEVLQDLLTEGKTELDKVLEGILNSKLNKELAALDFKPLPLSKEERFKAIAFGKTYNDRKVARLKA